MRRAALALAAACGLGGCVADAGGWHEADVSNTAPGLAFRLTRASDGRQVSAADYRGKLMLLYFGYTSCPDVCPVTLARLTQALARVPDAQRTTRVLFVSVDPARDTLAGLGRFASAFGPEFDGAKASPDELAILARRYRIAYSVTPDPDPMKWQVSHSSVVYAFDRKGRARLLLTALVGDKPDIPAAAADLARLERE